MTGSAHDPRQGARPQKPFVGRWRLTAVRVRKGRFTNTGGRISERCGGVFQGLGTDTVPVRFSPGAEPMVPNLSPPDGSGRHAGDDEGPGGADEEYQVDLLFSPWRTALKHA